MDLKVLITGSSKFPVPAVKGGAVPNLIEELIQQQQEENKIELTCCSLWDSKAEQEALKYTNTEFIWAKTPEYISSLDHAITWILKKIFRVNRLLSIGFLFQVIWFTFYIAKVLKKNDYDRVIFENSVPMLFAMKLYGNRKKYKDKYYIHMHSVPRKYYGNSKIFSECKGLISISDYVAISILEDSRSGIKKSQIRIMYNCIDTEKIRPLNSNINMKEKYNIPVDKKIILFAGRLCKEKGIEEVLKMMTQVQEKNTVLVVVGANFYSSGIVSPYEKYLQNLAVPLKDRIKFTGYVNYQDMAQIYNMADVVVLPSMWDEPAGMTIIEAMACRKPVITTISGGIPEYTGNNTCVLLKRDEKLVENLAKTVDKILNDNDYGTRVANLGYKRAQNYNKRFYYNQLLEILKEE